jgi:hypothetical protein
MPATCNIAPPRLEFAFLIRADLEPSIAVGRTPDGQRTHIPISGGHVEGPRLRAKVLTGADRLLVRNDGVAFIDALYEIETDDGVLITVHNSGPAAVAAGGSHPHTTLRFTAPEGRHDWLNKSSFVGTLEPHLEAGHVLIRVDQAI